MLRPDVGGKHSVWESDEKMNLHVCKCWRSFVRWLLTVWLPHIQSSTNYHTGIDEVFDSESHLLLSAREFPPSDTLWILSFSFTARLSTVFKVSVLTAPRLFRVCLFVPGPWEESGIVKGGRREREKKKKKKAIPFPGLIAEAGASDMSWLKQHHFCHSCLAADLTNDAGGPRHMPLSMV